MRNGIASVVRISVLSTALFGCASQPPTMSAYDGHWASDIPVQGRCPAAHWEFDVKNHVITGAAKNPAGTFVMSGTLDESGKGTIKINQFAGTIQFVGDHFESDYFNACGARHAAGARVP
jgi:hypothetical protein